MIKRYELTLVVDHLPLSRCSKRGTMIVSWYTQLISQQNDLAFLPIFIEYWANFFHWKKFWNIAFALSLEGSIHQPYSWTKYSGKIVTKVRTRWVCTLGVCALYVNAHYTWMRTRCVCTLDKYVHQMRMHTRQVCALYVYAHQMLMRTIRVCALYSMK